MKTIGILTSGGDAPGMNAAIRAAVRGGIYHGLKIYGIERGFDGLIEGAIKEMNVSSVSDILHKGGTMLRTARSQRFMTDEGFKRALSMLDSFSIEGLVIIGGDGSMTGGVKLDEAGITVMGVPGTIDNDLAYTDFSVGFDTAVNTVLSSISNIRDTSSSHERSTVIEVMGRLCGDIALYSGVTGGAETILIPEIPIDINAVCKKIIQGRNRGKLHNIIVKAEGVDIKAEELADVIKERTGVDTKIVVLSYVQRGGSPTARDRMLASRMGYKAIELLKDDSSSKAIGTNGNAIVSYELAEALKMTRDINTEFLELADVLSI